MDPANNPDVIGALMRRKRGNFVPAMSYNLCFHGQQFITQDHTQPVADMERTDTFRRAGHHHIARFQREVA